MGSSFELATYLLLLSCELDLNMDYLLKKIWETLNLTRIYTKRKGERPDTSGGIVMRNSPTVEHVVSIFFFFLFLYLSSPALHPRFLPSY